ncbi:hypothetical protein [Aggregatibacter sp.]
MSDHVERPCPVPKGLKRFNKAMIDDANDQANNTKESNKRYYDKKH